MATMAKVFRLSNREASIISKIESSKEYARRQALNKIRDCIDPLSNAIASKLIESNLIETANKNAIEEQIMKCLENLMRAESFDIEYMVAPFKHIVHQTHVVSLFVTAFVIEQLINHKDVIDIFGSDLDIYNCINTQVKKYLP
jgi:hypothetical protein